MKQEKLNLKLQRERILKVSIDNELDNEILKTILKGLNELEGNIKKSFPIKNLTLNELTFLRIRFLSNYHINIKMGNTPSAYELEISKMLINQRGYSNA